LARGHRSWQARLAKAEQGRFVDCGSGRVVKRSVFIMQYHFVPLRM